MNSKSEKPTFTPGPWWFAQNESDFAVGAGNDELALVGQTGLQDAASHERNRANARLIAAAPALYAALEALYNRVERDGLLYKGSNPMLPALAALRAARGEP